MPATGTIARTRDQRARRRHHPGGRHRARGHAAGRSCCWPRRWPRSCRWRRWPASCCSWPGTWASGTSSRGCAISAPPYRTILLGTFFLTVVFDLTVAVEVGLVLACVFFIYRMSTLFTVKPHEAGDCRPACVLRAVRLAVLRRGGQDRSPAGPIAARHARRGARDAPPGVARPSGLDALQQLHRTLKRQGIGLVLAHVNEQPLSLIRRSGFAAMLGEEAIVPTVAGAFDATPMPRV